MAVSVDECIIVFEHQTASAKYWSVIQCHNEISTVQQKEPTASTHPSLENANIPIPFSSWPWQSTRPPPHKFTIPLPPDQPATLPIPHHLPPQHRPSRPLIQYPPLKRRVIHIMMQHAVRQCYFQLSRRVPDRKIRIADSRYDGSLDGVALRVRARRVSMPGQPLGMPLFI
jgi:hypothetical protein